MLNIKEQTIKELDELKPEALARVYDLITELKRTNQGKKSKMAAIDYIKVREALKQCKGSLSEDIILEREEWMKENIGQSVQSKKKEVLSLMRKTEQIWDQSMAIGEG